MWLITGVLLSLLGTSFSQAACGKRPSGSRIVGGSNAQPNSWPWQLSLRVFNSHNCGASLISREWAVTAAHCVDRSSDPNRYTLLAGAHHRTSGGQVLRISQVIKHEGFSMQHLKNDIAVLKLASPVTLTPKIQTICLPSQGSRVAAGHQCYITGWGRISSQNNVLGTYLQQAKVPIASHQQCLSKNGNIVHEPSMVCAGGVGSSACNGDSGGPLACEENGRWILRGAASWVTSRTCPGHTYSVYARVSEQINWISSKTGGNQGTPAPATPAPGCGGGTTPAPLITNQPTAAPQAGECNSPRLLSESDRVRTFNDRKVVKCDNSLSEGSWYRFSESAGAQIPEAVVPTRHCGTHAPGWMDGKHPSVGEGVVSRKVCFHWTSGNCQWSKVIQVRNCGNFYVYKLLRPPGCSMRYCGEHMGGVTTMPPTQPPMPTTVPSGTRPPQPQGGCGVSPVSRVIGGVDATPGQWPWQIALLNNGGFSCGGSLIASDWVVTAAHCVARSPNAANYKVRVGEHNRNVNEGSEEDIPAKRVIVHPSYGNPVLNNDIALIQLSRHANLQHARVATVCLPAHGEQVPTSSRCFITGWGKIKHPGSSHHILQQANLPPVTNDVCAKKLAASPGGSSLKITPNMICAGKAGTILSGCHGDSGGPFVCQNSAGRWVLQGAVSWGSPRCSAAERYTVFARVAMFRQWIDQYTGGSGGTPPPPNTPQPPTQPPSGGHKECSSYKTLSDAERNIGHVNQKVTCDRDFAGEWYRFTGQAGCQMPESSVPTSKCGTHAPGWLDGRHPSVAEGMVSRKVCFHWSGNNCRWSSMIQVRNCGGAFYVYKLGKPPACSLRYCGESNGGTPPPPPPNTPPPPGTPPPPPNTLPPPGTPPPPGSCGIRPSSRIVGGTAAKHGDWPWQAMLRTTSGFPYCGGTLVSPQWVVTATHCVTGKSPSSIIIRMGAHKRTSTVGSEQDIKVTKVITHPSYHKPQRYSHDIALLKLERPAALNRYVNLACLPNSVAAPLNGTKCWITGWGRLSSGGATPDLLQQVSVPVVSRARCDKAYPGKIHNSMICAGQDQGGIDSCQGDSGGPMVCESGGRYYLHGATSWGYGCAAPGKFGVYAKVKYLMSWLNSEMAKN